MEQYYDYLKNIILNKYKVKYTFPIKNIKSVLVIAPHPDDETLGCGGTILRLHQEGAKTTVVLMTDGSSGRKGRETSHIRANEFAKATEIIGFDEILTLSYPDGELLEHCSLAKVRMKKIIDETSPDLIFTPYFLDLNKDHISTNLIIKDAIADDDTYIAMYEIWTPILYPDCYINISDTFDKKLAAIECYQSQEAYYRIKDKSVTLNSLRANLSMKRNIKFTEAFQLFSTQDYIQIINSFYSGG